MTKLKRIRTEMGLTQRDVSQRSGISQTRICTLENNERMMDGSSTYTICCIANALNVKMWEIIDNEKFATILKEVSKYPKDTEYGRGDSHLLSLRMKRRISQAHLAKALGVAQSAISRWENDGIYSMRLSLLCELCVIMYCHPCDIIDGLREVL